MGSVYPRGSVLWITYKNAEGKWKAASTRLRVGDEKKARALLAKVEARVAAGALPDGETGPATVARFAKPWLAARRDLGLADVNNDEARLRDHVLSTLGAMPIAEVRPRHLVDLFAKLRRAGQLAPKTLRNIYATVTALFRDAVIRDLIESSPCVLTKHHLGENEDADPEWRETAVYTRDELVALVSDPRIPWDRRVWYALEGIAGLRLGEAAGLRVRHYKRELQPLRGLTVAFSYNRPRPKKGIRHMPVHPVLAAVLDAWLAEGWASQQGRAPEPDDLLVPLPPEHAARRRGEKRGQSMRCKTYCFKRVREDLAALGLRHRRSHDLRRSMISIARTDGARAELLERCTHNPAKKERSIDVYSTFEWAPLCAEVAKMRLDPPTAAEVPTTPLATADGSTAEIPGENEWRRRESKPALRTLAEHCRSQGSDVCEAIRSQIAETQGQGSDVDSGLTTSRCSSVVGAPDSPGDLAALLVTTDASALALLRWYEAGGQPGGAS